MIKKKKNVEEKFHTGNVLDIFDTVNDFRVKIFNTLGIGGISVNVVLTVMAFLAGYPPIIAYLNIACGLIAAIFLFRANKKKLYKTYYVISIVIVFLMLFPVIFFASGGYKSSMGSYFVFSVLFTVFMLSGRRGVYVALIEIFVYVVCYFLSYFIPSMNVTMTDDYMIFLDMLIGFVAISLILALTMYKLIGFYENQNNQLADVNEKADIANRAKSIFLANISHEIRTPIHVITSVNEMISRDTHSPKIKEYSRKISESNVLLRALVDNVLDVSKIEAGKMEIVNNVYDTEDLISAMALTGRTWCEKKDLFFQVSVDEDLPAKLFGDAVRLRQIANNLLSNAVKYTSRGSVTFKVYKEKSAGKDEIMLCMSVEDTGIGIKEHDKEALFDSFSRVDQNTNHYIEGSGLGLAIVRELTALMEGSVSLSSEYGVGSTFTVRVSQRIPTGSEYEVKNARRMTFSAPKANVLIVDDNKENLSSMSLLLERSEVNLDLASSGLECLELCRNKQYHVIITDYMMPELNGLDTYRELKKIPGFNTPVIILTANATTETKSQLMDERFAAYATKPISWDDLEGLLIRFLPSDLVKIVLLEDVKKKDLSFAKKYLTEGIDFSMALDFFDGDVNQYSKIAKIFLKFYSKERENMNYFVITKDYSSLKFSVHALKGKAKNLGAIKLSDVALDVEELINSQKYEEVAILAPYLLYLWQQFINALSRLCDEIDLLYPKQALPKVTLTYAECVNSLTELIETYQRKPAIERLSFMIKSESDIVKKELLRRILEEVNDLSFESALKKYLVFEERYIRRRVKGKEV